MEINFGVENRFFLLLIVCVVRLSCSDHFFLVNKYEGDHYYCITDSSFALSWIDEVTTTDFNSQVSQFIPNHQHNVWNVSCKDSGYKQWKCTKTMSDEVILDRRWEEFTSYQTNYVEDSPELQFTTVATLQKKFEIPFSIRIDKEAHIFLCDGGKVAESNCYWVMLQAFSGSKTAIRKCSKGEIPTKSNTLPGHPCNLSVAEITHPSVLKYLTSQVWNHIILSNINNNISLGIPDNKYPIINYYEDNMIDVTHMIIHSKNVVGLWKIHEREYLHSTSAARTEFKPVVFPIDGAICISMFINMCFSCRIKIQLMEPENQKRILREEVYKFKPRWREIQIQTDNVQTDRVSLVVTTIVPDNSGHDPFWSIGYIKQCHQHGFRMIKRNQRAKCQLTSSKNYTLTLEGRIDTTSVSNSCNEETVTDYCIPCLWFMEKECGQLKICEKENNVFKCSCAAGYKTNYNSTATDQKCNAVCAKGYFGHKCQNKCGNCEKACNNVAGTCAPCTENYSGRKCDIPPAKMFKEPPKVIDITYTEATVQVTRFDLIDETVNDGDPPKTYTIQYKIKGNKSTNWTSTKTKYTFNETITAITIKGLKPGTKYFVRCVIITGEKIYYDDRIPITSFTTKCDDIEGDNFDIEVSNTSATISLVIKPPDRTCKFNKAQIDIPKTNGPKNFRATQFYVDELTPYTTYTIFTTGISGTKSEKSFTTKEGVPDKIPNLGFKNITSSSVYLHWTPPVINGELKHYIVEYQLISFIACNGKNVIKDVPKANVKTTEENSYNVSKLKPYSEYLFSVSTQNGRFQGHKKTVHQSTSQLDRINDDEIPKVEINKRESRKVCVEFSSVYCSKIRGPLQIQMNATCNNEWCKNVKGKPVEYNARATMYCFENLVPFSNYTLEIKFCRKEEICRRVVKSMKFQTEAIPPYAVKELTAYSKNNSSISLRWKQQYPPTGILELFHFRYNMLETNNEEKAINVSSYSSCKLWAEYYCWTLSDLKYNTQYSIMVQAKNINVENFGQTAAPTLATTKVESSEAPEKLTLHWTLENNLNLSWSHPIIANGDISFFNITVLPYNGNNETNIRETFEITKDGYQAIYHHIVNISPKQFLPSTLYRITIAAFNGLNGKGASNSDISPPSIPLLASDPECVSTNTTIPVNLKNANSKWDNDYELFIFILDTNVNKSQHPSQVQTFSNKFRINLSKFKIIYECKLKNLNSSQFIIGKNTQNVTGCNHTHYPQLKPGTDYNVTLLLINTFESKSSYKLYSYKRHTSGSILHEPSKQSSGLFALLILLLIIPIAVVIYIKRRPIIATYNTVKKNIYGGNTPDLEPSHEDQTPLTSFPNGPGVIKNSKTQRVEEETVNAEIIYSKPIEVEKYQKYVQSSLVNGELESQHRAILNEFNQNYEIPQTSLFLDYVDIHYISGLHISQVYIAAETPKQAQVDDFWTLIWKENVGHIVLLDYSFAEQQVSKHYWPDKDNIIRCHNISVHCIQNNTHPTKIIATLMFCWNL